MESFVIVAIVFVIIFLCASGSTPVPKEKDLPTTTHAKCPFCGADNPSRTYIPSKEPVPAIFKCGECSRYYGDTSKMTAEERKKVEKSNQDCNRVDKMPEKTAVVEAVVAYFKSARSFRVDGDLGMVTIQQGEVKVSSCNPNVRRVLATYPYISEIADQRLTLMSYNQAKREMPYKNFSYGYGWVCEEKNRS